MGKIKLEREYRQLRRDLSELSIEIVGKTPEFHALHWEALHDPELTRSLAVDSVMVRKSVKPAPISANVEPSPLINLLVVISRPDEEKDVGYRTISRPLIEAVQNSQLRVNVELLRPGTYEALSRHLEEKGAGYYHVIHLDMHGALMTYEQLQQPSQPNRYLYKGRYGRDDFAQFDGVKAFLAFEGETQGKVDLVEASELAGLLTLKGIPVCILNACQSGKQVKPNPPAPFPAREGGGRNYQLALEIWLEFGDRYSSASTYHQLGIVAQELREWKEARRNYQLALEIYIEFSDRYSSASTYHNLGVIAEELREFREARRNYQLALEIKLEFGDRYSSASTYHQLGNVAQYLREWKEARRNYQLALEIFVEFGDRYSSASTYHNLGVIAEELREFREARRNYQLALEIKLEFGDRYNCASIYGQLGLLAEEEEDYTEARANLQKALEIFIEYQDEYCAAIARKALERLPE